MDARPVFLLAVKIAGRVGSEPRSYGTALKICTNETKNANGNTTQEQLKSGTTVNSYDKENRLIGISASGGVSTYTYDGDGLRRSAQEPGGLVSTMIWDGSDYLGEI